MQNKRVLVTGGAGFIGSNIANHLAADNDVIAVDDCYLGTPENLSDQVEFVNKSVVDEDLPTDVDIVFPPRGALLVQDARGKSRQRCPRQCRGIREHDRTGSQRRL